MKKLISALLISLTMSTGATAAPFLAAGDGAELFLTGTLGVRSDDNVYLSSTETDDLIIDINPGFEFVFGQGSATQGYFKFVESIARYSDNDNLDTELAAINFVSRYDDGKSKLNADVNWAQLNQNTFDVRGLTRRDVFGANVMGEVSVTEKSSIGFGGAYNNTDYKRTGYSDLKTFTIPVTYYYELSPKVDLSLGFRYRDTDSQLGVDSKDYAYRVGFRGEFTPKVIGSLAVGFGSREFDSGGDESILDIDGAINFLVSEKTTFQVNVSNDFGDSAQGQQQKSFVLGGQVINKATDQWAVRAGLNYRKIDYYTRTDDYVEMTLGADYTVSTNVTIQGSYAYRNYESDITGGGFTNNVFSLAANFRY